ncbi:transcriptional regulator [Dolosicoccus paucivorans]|uniref:autorepressor SdpR family transcription factor n=1 Tax=Dolosicoccus paucivorans TaxID=84521 RepID=UPI000C80ACB6|nr:autorepressor SdpR family transcription factor [Dolosicoccus paucivorans]PMB83781.1 transcriptional regulator [Dolosicoccus paucivorans]
MTFAKTFKALADPERRKILELLKEGAMSAGDIASNFSITQATVSYHLKVLKEADLIFEKKDKNYVYYQLNASVLEELMLWMANLRGVDDDV